MKNEERGDVTYINLCMKCIIKLIIVAFPFVVFICANNNKPLKIFKLTSHLYLMIIYEEAISSCTGYGGRSSLQKGNVDQAHKSLSLALYSVNFE